jgi:uncharacterized protein YndB with AHSA1/START domain
MSTEYGSGEQDGATAGEGVDPNEFSITRVLSAPREQVFAAWTEADQLTQWWGPVGFALTVLKLEVRPGGIFHYQMDASGFSMWGRFIYQEIEAPERLVWVSSFADQQCAPTHHPMAPLWPLETLTTLTLAEDGGLTTLTLRAVPANAGQAECETFRAGFVSMTQGFGATLNQLETHLERLAGAA